MPMKVLISLLLLQASTLMAEECSNQEIITEKITDADQLLGDWSVVYYWTKKIDFSAMGRSQCFNSSMSSVTAEEIAAKKEECKHSQVPFDYDSVVLKITIPEIPSSNRLVSHDGENAYIQQTCYLVTKSEARRVNDNNVLIMYPGSDVAELLSKTVPEREDLICTVRNIDVMKNKIGFPVCYT